MVRSVTNGYVGFQEHGKWELLASTYEKPSRRPIKHRKTKSHHHPLHEQVASRIRLVMVGASADEYEDAIKTTEARNVFRAPTRTRCTQIRKTKSSLQGLSHSGRTRTIGTILHLPSTEMSCFSNTSSKTLPYIHLTRTQKLSPCQK